MATRVPLVITRPVKPIAEMTTEERASFVTAVREKIHQALQAHAKK